MYIIMGVPGAGKSTVINKFKEKNEGWEVVNYGTLMFEIAKKFGINDRDEMRKADINLQKKIQKEVGEELSKISREKEKLILDTHASIKTKKGYMPGLPESLLKGMKVNGIILITADAEEIDKRRKKDKSRERDSESIEEIKKHELINIAMCSNYAVISSCPFSIIRNKEGLLEESVKKLEDVLL